MTLKQLYNSDKEALAEIKNYLESYLKEYGVAKMFKGEDVKAVGEAKAVIDEAWDHLDLLFGAKPKKKKIKNESR